MIQVITLLLLLLASTASAQDAYELRVYAPAATTPQVSTQIPAANVVCNLAQPAPTSTVNPHYAWWDDRLNPGRACRWDLSAPGSVLVSLPPGGYEGTLIYINAAGPSPESNRASFTRLDPTAAPTVLRFIQ